MKKILKKSYYIYMNSFAMCQQLSDSTAKPIDVDSNILSYPTFLFLQRPALHSIARQKIYRLYLPRP